MPPYNQQRNIQTAVGRRNPAGQKMPMYQDPALGMNETKRKKLRREMIFGSKQNYAPSTVNYFKQV